MKIENNKKVLDMFYLAKKDRLKELNDKFNLAMRNAKPDKKINEYNRFVNEWGHDEAQKAFYTDGFNIAIKRNLKRDENTINFNWEANFINWAKGEDVDESKIKGFAVYLATSDFWDVLHKYERTNFHSIIEPTDTIIETSPNIPDSAQLKINWQGQSNTLTYLFRQLKTSTNKNGLPLITNSYDEIAYFLKNNFQCFENVAISTISGQIKKNQKPKKVSKSIEIYI